MSVVQYIPTSGGSNESPASDDAIFPVGWTDEESDKSCLTTRAWKEIEKGYKAMTPVEIDRGSIV